MIDLTIIDEIILRLVWRIDLHLADEGRPIGFDGIQLLDRR